MNQEFENAATAATMDSTPPPLPGLFKRLGMVLVQPGEMFRALAAQPVAWGALLVSALLSGFTVWLMPAEVFTEGMAQGGQEIPVSPAFVKMMGTISAPIAVIVFTLLFAGITFVIFRFIRGDEVTYKQHFAVLSHTSFITAVGGIFVALLMMSGMMSVDARGFSVGTFFQFLPDGYLVDVLSGLSLFSLWAAVVAGLGLSLLDARRSWGPTAGILVFLQIAWAMVQALLGFSPTG